MTVVCDGVDGKLLGGAGGVERCNLEEVDGSKSNKVLGDKSVSQRCNKVNG